MTTTFKTNQKKYFVYGFEIIEKRLIERLIKSNYFNLVEEKRDSLLNNTEHYYEYVGYRYPLLCTIMDTI